MFQCQLCRRVAPQRTPAQRVVVQTRPKKYPFRSDANRIVRLSDNGKRRERFIDDPGGVGREIVLEVLVCPDCASNCGGE